jgi:hypothetical protein
VLHTGARGYNYEDRLHAVPIDRLWTGSSGGPRPSAARWSTTGCGRTKAMCSRSQAPGPSPTRSGTSDAHTNYCSYIRIIVGVEEVLPCKRSTHCPSSHRHSTATS